MNNVGEIIEANIVKVVNFLEASTFNECTVISKMLEMELGRTKLMREQIEFKTDVIRLTEDERKNYTFKLINLFVVEQKIIDRLDLVLSYVITKGVM